MINRKHRAGVSFLLVSVVLLVLVEGLGAQTPDAGAPSNSRPNIILFLGDDVSYWDFSCFGQKEFSTPHLDRMAREGMVFANAYASSPECAPSRAGLLTGLHMGHSPIRRLGTDVRPALSDRPYLTDQETVAETLRRSGYATCHVGKWHVGEPGTPGMPHLQGFESTLSFDHSLSPRARLDQQYTYPDRLWRDGQQIQVPENRGFSWEHRDNHFDKEGRFVPGGVKDPAKARHGEDMFLEKALEFINQPREKPFFLFYASPLTHAMWPAELRELKDKKAPWTLDQKKWAGQVTQMDRSLGAIMAALEARGIEKNTIIVFTSDNGYSAWGYPSPKRGRWVDDPVLHNKGPWHGGKFGPVHGGVIVPFVAWGPGRVRAGKTTRAVAQYDIKSTFADLAGAKLRQPTDGVSFSALLAGRDATYAKRPFLYWEACAYAHTAQYLVLDERYFVVRTQPGQPISVYDTVEDVGCKKNIAAGHPELVQRAESLFVSEHAAHPLGWYDSLTDAPGKLKPQKGNVKRGK